MPRPPIATAPRFPRSMWPAGRFRLPPRVAFRARRALSIAIPNATPETVTLWRGDVFELLAAEWLGHPDQYAATIGALRHHPDLVELPA